MNMYTCIHLLYAIILALKKCYYVNLDNSYVVAFNVFPKFWC
jgi:hypothetical protein